MMMLEMTSRSSSGESSRSWRGSLTGADATRLSRGELLKQNEMQE